MRFSVKERLSKAELQLAVATHHVLPVNRSFTLPFPHWRSVHRKNIVQRFILMPLAAFHTESTSQ